MGGVHVLDISSADEGQRLDRWFRRLYPHIAHGRVEKLLRTGQIRVDGGRVKGSHRLSAGETVRIPPLAEPSAPKISQDLSRSETAFIRDLVIYEDDDLIAINKPYGLAVQGGSKTVDHIDRLLPALGGGVRLVHRLDRDTSGVLLLAKSQGAAAKAGRAFQSRRADKIYWGITNGVPKPDAGEVKGYVAKGQLDNRFGNDKAGREIMQAVHHGTVGAKYARTLYQTAQSAGQKAAWIVLKPLTGRTHQLRLHMQLLGAPIAGDPKYLTDRPLPGGLDNKLHLHARSLTLPWQKGEISIEAEMPAHMQNAFDVLGFDTAVTLEPWEAV